jgi:hypothetical protein
VHRTSYTYDIFLIFLQPLLAFKEKISCAPGHLFSRALIKSRCFNLDLEEEWLVGVFAKLAGGGGRV